MTRPCQVQILSTEQFCPPNEVFDVTRAWMIGEARIRGRGYVLISVILHIIVIISSESHSRKGHPGGTKSQLLLSIGVYLVSLVNVIGDCNRNFQAAAFIRWLE
jgi:hypothetical protein